MRGHDWDAVERFHAPAHRGGGHTKIEEYGVFLEIERINKPVASNLASAGPQVKNIPSQSSRFLKRKVPREPKCEAGFVNASNPLHPKPNE
jgi:hypothetical protein